MKKSAFWIISLATILTVLSSCVVPAPTPEKVVETVVVEKPVEPITIKFFSHRFTEVPYGDILRKQVLEYEALHPNIKVQPIEVPTGERFAKFPAMVLGGSPPDAVFAARDTGYYIPQGLLMDLEPYIEKAGGKAYKERFPEHSWSSVTDPKTGHWRAIPAEQQMWSLVVNVDLAEEVGVELPEDRTWTWEEFMAAAEKFTRDTDGDGKVDHWAYTNYGTGSPSGQAIVVGQWMLANGGTWWGFNSDCTEVNLMIPENIEAFKHYISLGVNGYQPPGYVERGGGDHYRLLGEGAAAMAVTHPGGIAMATELSGGVLRLYPMFLPGPGQKVSLYTEAWAIAEGAEHPDEAWEFINWLNTDEKQLERMQVQGTLPASLSALEKVKEVKPENTFWVDLIGVHTEPGCYEYLPRIGEIKQVVTDACTRAYQGEDPETVLQETQDKLTQILAEILAER